MCYFLTFKSSYKPNLMILRTLIGYHMISDSLKKISKWTKRKKKMGVMWVVPVHSKQAIEQIWVSQILKLFKQNNFMWTSFIFICLQVLWIHNSVFHSAVTQFPISQYHLKSNWKSRLSEWRQNPLWILNIGPFVVWGDPLEMNNKRGNGRARRIAPRSVTFFGALREIIPGI